MSEQQQPRPVPEAGIAQWTLDGYLWSARDQHGFLRWDVTSNEIDRGLAGESVRGFGAWSGREIILRAFGPADHKCPGASCDVPWCDHGSADTKPDKPKPATREIEARDLRAGMFWRCNCHFHEIVSSTDDGSLIRLALAPVAGCTWSLAATHTHNEKAVIRADHEPQRAAKPEPPARPTYRVPAREVVPGMFMHGQPITRVWRDTQQYSGETRAAWCTTTATGAWMNYTPWPLDKDVTITLPGPSPRELCCTCHLQGAPRVTEARPAEHRDCPVAPRPGVHGGMRLWPAPSSPGSGVPASPWVWRDGRYSTGLEWMEPPDVIDVDGLPDNLLMAFYLPPAPSPEPDRSIPVDIDIELEMVAARWGR